ncbi:MAG TPA: L,D-transpeptidase [Acidimicrobiales bacterium]|jgi:lipoprotein-anchoring transpeptidase ErfK/SrfK
MIRMRRGAAAAGVLLVLGVACTGGGSGDELDLSPPAESPFADIDSEGVVQDTSHRADTFHVAEATGDTLVVRATPEDNGDEIRNLTAAEEVSGRVVCLVSQELGDWVSIYLPTGPEETIGWVKRDDVTLTRHQYRIEVDRAAHTLTVFNGEDTVVSTPIAVGPDAPAPGSRLFVKDLVATPDPAGPYGTYAYGLSGSSNDLAAFASGTGVVALHGTNDPATLGLDVDHGAVALDPAALTNLVETVGLPLGTPVEVTG